MICFRAYMEAHAYQEELVKGVEPMALDWYRAHGVASMASTQYTRAMEAFVAFRQPEELRTFLKSLYDGMPYEEMRHPEYDLYVRAPR